MAKAKQPAQPPIPQPPAPIVLNLPSPLTLKLEPDAQLNVSVITPEKPKPPFNRLLAGFAAIFIGLAGFWLYLFYTYIVPRNYPVTTIRDASLSVAIAFPTYFTPGDEAEMEFNIANGGAESFTGHLTVCFADGAPVRPVPPETTTLEVQNLAPGASRSHRLKVALGKSPALFGGETVNSSLRLSTAQCAFQPIAGPQLQTAPWPYLRTINNWLSSTGVIAAIAAFLWEVMKKTVFGWEAK